MELSTSQWVLLLALALGLAYGAIAQISGFCLNGALRDQLTSNKGNKLRSFALAMLVAMLGSQLLNALGVIDLSQSIYQTPQASWILTMVGGILFGFGMIRTRGCGARSLVLLGQGNLRSLVVLLVMGITAYMTLSGVLGNLRDDLASLSLITTESGTFTTDASRWAFIVGFSGLLLWFVAKDRQFWNDRIGVIAGVVIGLLVVAGWLITGWVGFDDFEPTPLASLTFVAPVGATVQYAMIATGMSLNFGIVVIIGVVIGSFMTAKSTRTFRVQGFDKSTDMPKYLIGAACMGVGGALALGCSVGQGLTGFSTLSFISMVALVGILLGGWLALKLETSRVSTPKPVQRQSSSHQYE